MSLEAARARYGYKELSIATWRDPKLSVHPARGGPKSPTISPESASKPFVPKYKVTYRVPEPTDDEESEDEEDGKEEKGSEPPAEETIPAEIAPEPPAEENTPSDTAASETAELPPPEERSDPALISTDDSKKLESAPESPPNQSTDESLHAADSEPPVEPIAEPQEGISQEASSEAGPKEENENNESTLAPPVPSDNDSTQVGQDESDTAHDVPLDSVPPPAPDPPCQNSTEEEAHEIATQPTAEDPSGGSSPRSEDEVFHDAPPEAPKSPPAEPESVEPHATEAVAINEDHEDSEKKSVQFAPGTPEPKPTKRPKKVAKGAKGKKKKSAPVMPDEGDPDEIVAIVEGPADVAQPIDVDVVHDAPTDDAPASLNEPGTVQSVPVEESPAQEGIVEIIDEARPSSSKPGKKERRDKRTKSKSKGKEPEPAMSAPVESTKASKKSKKGSKSKSQDTVTPLGLGIEFTDASSTATLTETDNVPVVNQTETPQVVETATGGTPEPAPAPQDPAEEVSETVEAEVPSAPDEVGTSETLVGPSTNNEEPPKDDELSHAPSEEEAAKEEAAKEEAAKEEAPKEEGPKEEPAKEEPAKEEPAKEEPLQADEPAKERDPTTTDEKNDEQTEKDPPQSDLKLVADAPLHDTPEAAIETVTVVEETVKQADSDPINDAVVTEEDEGGEIGMDTNDAQTESLKEEEEEEEKATDVALTPPDSAVDLEETPDVDLQTQSEVGEEEPVSQENSTTDEVLPEGDGAGAELSAASSPDLDEQESGDEILVEHHDPGESKSAEVEKPVGDPEQSALGENEQSESGSGNDNEDSGTDVDLANPPEDPPESTDIQTDADQAEPSDAALASSATEQNVQDVAVDDPEHPVEEQTSAEPADATSAESGPEPGESVAARMEEPVEHATSSDSEATHAVDGSGKDVEMLEVDPAGPPAVTEAPPGEPQATLAMDVARGEHSGDSDTTSIKDPEPLPESSEETTPREHQLDIAREDAHPPEISNEAALEAARPDSSEDTKPRENEPEIAKEDITPPELPEVFPQSAEETENTEEPGVDEQNPDPPTERPSDPAPAAPAPVEAQAAEVVGAKETTPEAPALSRRSKTDHGERPPAKQTSRDRRSSEKSRPHPHSSKRSRSDKPRPLDEDAERQRRREARKAQEAARTYEQERRVAEAEELRQIRHEARRAARKAAAAEATRIAKEEAEAVAREEAERRRRRRESHADRARSQRDRKSTSVVPKLFGLRRGSFSRTDSAPVRTSHYPSREAHGSREEERPRTRRRSGAPREMLVVDDHVIIDENEQPAPTSSHDSSSHRRHRHHRHRSEGENIARRKREGDRHRRERTGDDSGESARKSKRSAPEPKSRGFFGSLFR